MSETPTQSPSPEGGETTKCRYCWEEIPADSKACPACGISRHQEKPEPSQAAQTGNKKSGCGASAVIGVLAIVALIWIASL